MQNQHFHKIFRIANKFKETIFLSEIISQCDYCLASFDTLNLALRQRNIAVVFRAAHYLVLHAASVSLLLWPTQGDMLRGEWLRHQLNIQEPHPLQNRKLRNLHEHFDEHLDDWAAAQLGDGGVFIDYVIGPRDQIGPGATDETMRHYDRDNNVFIFMGKEFDLTEIVDGARDVQIKANRRLAQLNRM